MKTGIKVFVVCIGGLMFFAVWGHFKGGFERWSEKPILTTTTPVASSIPLQKQDSSNSSSLPSVLFPQIQKQETLKVKGLYIGMDITEAYNICAQLCKGSEYRVEDIGEVYKEMEHTEHNKEFGFISGGPGSLGWHGEVSADRDGKVTLLQFEPGLVDYLFNVGEMEVTDFVQEFANSYHIPEFKVSSSGNYYYYDSPTGFRVEIDMGKNLTIKAIPSTQERKFD